MNLPEIPESPLEGINSLSPGQGGDRAALEQKGEGGLLNWAYNNIWKPGYNAGATTTLNEANQVVRLATFGYVDLRKESETYKHYASVYRDIPKAEVGTAEWFVQTASGGVGGMVPYLIAGKVLSKPLQGIAARTGLKCLASEKAELILGAAVADGLNAQEVGEDGKESTSRWYTRSLAGVAGLGIMTLGNASRMARTLGVVGRIGVGAIGANIQNAVTVGIDEHRRPTWEEVKEHGVSGAGMNSVMPVVHKWISKGAHERSQAERHNKELSKGRKVEEYGQYLGEMEAPRKSVWESIPKGPRETWEALKQGIGAFFIPKTIWGQSRTLREVVWESRLDKLGTRVRGSEKGSHADHVRDEVYIEKMKAGSEREKVEVIAKYGEECQHRILTKDPTIQIEFNKLRERMVQGENVEEGYIKLRVRMESEAREVGKKIREELQDKEGARAVTLDQEAILNERTPDGRTYKEHFAEEYQEFERTKNENEPTQLTRDYHVDSDNQMPRCLKEMIDNINGGLSDYELKKAYIIRLQRMKPHWEDLKNWLSNELTRMEQPGSVEQPENIHRIFSEVFNDPSDLTHGYNFSERLKGINAPKSVEPVAEPQATAAPINEHLLEEHLKEVAADPSKFNREAFEEGLKTNPTAFKKWQSITTKYSELLNQMAPEEIGQFLVADIVPEIERAIAWRSANKVKILTTPGGLQMPIETTAPEWAQENIKTHIANGGKWTPPKLSNNTLEGRLELLERSLEATDKHNYFCDNPQATGEVLDKCIAVNPEIGAIVEKWITENPDKVGNIDAFLRAHPEVVGEMVKHVGIEPDAIEINKWLVMELKADPYIEFFNKHPELFETLQGYDELNEKFEAWQKEIEDKGEDPSMYSIIDCFKANPELALEAYKALHPNPLSNYFASNPEMTRRLIHLGAYDKAMLGEALYQMGYRKAGQNPYQWVNDVTSQKTRTLVQDLIPRVEYIEDLKYMLQFLACGDAEGAKVACRRIRGITDGAIPDCHAEADLKLIDEIVAAAPERKTKSDTVPELKNDKERQQGNGDDRNKQQVEQHPDRELDPASQNDFWRGNYERYADKVDKRFCVGLDENGNQTNDSSKIKYLEPRFDSSEDANHARKAEQEAKDVAQRKAEEKARNAGLDPAQAVADPADIKQVNPKDHTYEQRARSTAGYIKNIVNRMMSRKGQSTWNVRAEAEGGQFRLTATRYNYIFEADEHGHIRFKPRKDREGNIIPKTDKSGKVETKNGQPVPQEETRVSINGNLVLDPKTMSPMGVIYRTDPTGQNKFVFMPFEPPYVTAYSALGNEWTENRSVPGSTEPKVFVLKNKKLGNDPTRDYTIKNGICERFGHIFYVDKADIANAQSALKSGGEFKAYNEPEVNRYAVVINGNVSFNCDPNNNQLGKVIVSQGLADGNWKLDPNDPILYVHYPPPDNFPAGKGK